MTRCPGCSSPVTGGKRFCGDCGAPSARLLRILRFDAHDLKLVPSITVYTRWGKGPFHPRLFSGEESPRGAAPRQEAAGNR